MNKYLFFKRNWKRNKRDQFDGLIISSLLSLLLLVSCNQVSEDLDTIAYAPEFAIPVITDAAVSFTELWENNSLEGQSLIVGADGVLIFKYESEPIEVTTLDVIGALDFPIVSSLTDPISALPFTLPTNILLQKATLSGGTILFQFKPINDQIVDITFILPQVTLNDTPLTIQTSGATGRTAMIDFAGYTFEPTDNELAIEYIAIDEAGNSVVLEGLGVIARPALQFVSGTWGREEFELPASTVPIDLYDERFLNGNLRFSQPTITANIESSFGVPIRSRVDILKARTRTGWKMDIDASAIDGVDINYPLLVERGTSKKTILQIDYTNSNIVEVFDTQPTELEYGLTAITNPEDDEDLTVFIEDTSTFKAEIIVEVPVVGRVENFIATENFDVPFADIDAISEGEFKLIVENELPIGATLQFYFLKGNKLIIDSLFQAIPQLIEPANIDETGNVTQAIETTTFIPISAAKMANIIEADRVKVKATFQTAGNGVQDVAVKADQTINFRMGLRFTL